VPAATLDNPGPGNSFGISVAISGARVVVGARYNSGFTDLGRAYVYDLASATPTAPVATLDNPSPSQNDFFGSAVAISGTRVVIGAFGNFAGASAAGSAYVYDLAGGAPTVPVLTLNNPSPGPSDFFGVEVAISGARVVIAARDDDTGAVDAGIAYVYDIASDDPLNPITLENPSPAAGDRFGSSVAIHGTRVVVGARGDEAGAPSAGSAYVYDIAGATPMLPVVTLHNPTPAQNDLFGVAVAISGTRVLIGASGDDTAATDAGSAYLYELTSSTPTVPVATLNSPGVAGGDRFGSAVAISGTLMVVGAPNDDIGATDAGSAYVYDLVSTTPAVPVLALHNPSPASNDHFGAAVAISGTRVVIGASDDDTGALDAGSAYVYDLASGTPTVPLVTLANPTPAQSDSFGNAVAISGTRVIVGAYLDDAGALDAGSVYIYDLAGATPTVPVLMLANPSPALGDRFGRSVAVSGTRVLIAADQDDTGSVDAGSAYVYDLASATPALPIITLNNPTPAGNEYYGFSVAISGTRAVIGAYGDSTGAGAAGSAYVYDLAGATPALPVATLNNPAPGGGDNFGYSVAISGTRIIIGAYLDDAVAGDSGSAYVYDLSSATPAVPVATLNNPSPATNDRFATSVAIDGTAVAIGAPLDDTVALDKGYAYVFAPANPDFDGDGLLDIWEYAWFGSTAVVTALDDTDGDGRNELLEVAFNGSPIMSDPWAAPAVTSEDGFLTMTIQKRAGVSYLVETAGSPDDAAFSSATTTTLINNATTLKVRDNFTPATAAQRMIRVRVNAAPY
jgi:hypothetical protein